ncbi:lysoplasmalogenase [Phaeovulum sp.]|uniref:lysoplasmalogenase n=1 Tax=Phaeovulum sp. TaxID=2934796 RepID=UPI00356A589E
MDLAQGLVVAAAVLAVVYALRWAAADAAPNWPRSLTKTGAVALLSIAAWRAGAPWLIVAGLALGAAGDFALSRPGARAFLAGMAAFAAGHLAYVLAFAAPLVIAGQAGGAGWAPSPGDYAVIGALALLLASTELWLAPHTGEMRWPVRAYVVVIGLMAVAALVPGGSGGVALRAGVALFVASDLMLALEQFVVRAPARRQQLARALWPAYWCAQALILMGSLQDPGVWWLIAQG